MEAAQALSVMEEEFGSQLKERVMEYGGGGDVHREATYSR